MDDIRIVAPLVPLGALSACLIDGRGASAGHGRTWPSRAWASQSRASSSSLVRSLPGSDCTGRSSPGAYRSWPAWLASCRHLRRHPQIRGPSDGAARRLAASAAIRCTAGGVASSGRAGTSYAAKPGQAPRARAFQRMNGARGSALEFWRFTAPRACQGTFQVTILWLDILLVGALVSRHAAGVYAAVSKLAMVGTFALEGTRLAISPQVSALLARGEHHRAAALYQTATRWLMLAAWPLYLVFAIFPAVVLGIFGPRYAPRRGGARRPLPRHACQPGDRQRDSCAADGRKEFLGRDQHRSSAHRQHRPEPPADPASRHPGRGDRMGRQHRGGQRRRHGRVAVGARARALRPRIRARRGRDRGLLRRRRASWPVRCWARRSRRSP